MEAVLEDAMGSRSEDTFMRLLERLPVVIFAVRKQQPCFPYLRQLEPLYDVGGQAEIRRPRVHNRIADDVLTLLFGGKKAVLPVSQSDFYAENAHFRCPLCYDCCNLVARA